MVIKETHVSSLLGGIPQLVVLSLWAGLSEAAIAMEVLLPGTVGHTCHGTEPVRSVSLSSR